MRFIPSNLLIAWRQISKNKLFTFINVLSLSIGISASLVIFMIVYHEFNYERFHPDGNRIYRVVTIMHFPDMEFKNSGVPAPMPEAAAGELTGIEKQAAFHLYGGEPKVTTGAADDGKRKTFRKQKDIIFADDQYFQLIGYRWLSGGQGRALNAPHQVVLTASRAAQYFPGVPVDQVTGSMLYYNDSVQAQVTGVVADLDAVTDFTFREFISMSTITATGLHSQLSWDQWNSVNSSSQFFVQLKPGVTKASVEKQLAAMVTKHSTKESLSMEHQLQPLADIHFSADYDNFSHRQGHKPTLYGLLGVGAFLLLLGCINFINLTTAQSVQRSKEVGVRKTMGGSRWQLIRQFMSETFLITFCATLLSVLMTPGILRIFADFIPEGINQSNLFEPYIIIFLLLIALLVCVASGTYPAFVLSRFAPVTVMKNQAAGNSQSRKAWVRKTLTISQFVIAQFFVIGILIMGMQISYSVNKDMGFRKDAIISFSTPWQDRYIEKRKVLLQELKRLPGIEMVSMAEGVPAELGYSATTLKFVDGKREVETTTEIKSADSNYFSLYQLQLAAGRLPADGDSVQKELLVNETLARKLGYQHPADIIGKHVETNQSNIPIVGVLKDYHFKSLHQPIGDLSFSNVSQDHRQFHVLLTASKDGSAQWQRVIRQIEEAYLGIFPELEFSYEFVDDQVAEFYRSEQQLSQLLRWAAGLSILISCLGLLGLVIYTTNSRTKEIGVRKVLGASVSQIVTLLSKDLLLLVLVAFVIAAPLAWWAGNAWLNDFAYRIHVSWWVFAAAGLGMLLMALLVLSIRTVQAALDNPVKSLRTE